jgi:chloride channel protein, CIC family
MPIDAAVAYFTDGTRRHRSYPVIAGDRRVVGMASRANVLRWMTEGTHERQTLDDLVSDASLVVGHPDEIVADLVRRMVENDIGRVPIVDPATRRLVGLVARKDLMRVRVATGRLESEREAFFGRRRRGTVPGSRD